MLEVNFPSGAREVSVFGLTQWDKGQKLSVSFDNMPESFQVHFSSRGSNEAVVVDAFSENGKAIVSVPDEMLSYDSDIHAWLYLTGESRGETIGKATLYVYPRPRPKGYIEDLVPSQQQLVEKMISEFKDKLQHVMENGVNSDYVPEYVRKESLETAKKVLECQNENTVSFFAASDFHCDNEDYYTEKAIEHMSQAMKIISSVCNIDFAVCLGDYIADRSDKSVSDAEDEFLRVNRALSEGIGAMPQLRAVGAEDLLSSAYYRNADYFDCNELYNLVGKWCSEAVFNPDDVTGSYCYRDFEKAKLRVICLNTSDFKNDVAVKPETNKAEISGAQLMWLCNALNLSEKENSNSWSTIVVSHFPVNYYNNFAALRNIITAYNSAGSVDFLVGDGSEISYNFSGKNSAPVLAFFNGALHNFKVGTLERTNIPLIGIPNVCNGNSNYFSDEKYTAEENLIYGESATWEKTPSSENDTSFCVVTLDKSQGKLFMHCYGAGYDRELSFDGVSVGPSVPDIGGGDGGSDPDDPGDDNTGNGNTDSGDSGGAYTNLVPESIDDIGDIFNRTGYMDGKYIDEAGDEASIDGFTVTGYIPAVNGDTVCVRGGNWSPADGNTILAYDETFCLLWSAKLSGIADNYSGISYNGDITVFNSLEVTNGNLSDMAYIRVSCSGSGENLIVTVNEDITSTGNSGTLPPVVEYVNIIPFAVDESSDNYNRGAGYMDGYALCADGSVNETEPDSSFTHTGFLYAEMGAVIRLKGYNWTEDDGNYLIIYDSDFIQYYTIEIHGETNDSTNGISFSGGVMTFDTSKVTAESLPDSFFIRFSTKTSGANLVATYNENLS